MRGFWGKAFAIVWKDILAEMRTKDMVVSMLVFSILVMVVFNFAFESSAEQTALVAPGVLWVTFTFAGVLGMNRSFVQEKDRGCLEGLMLCPLDRGVIYTGKMLGNLIFMLMVEAMVLPVFSILFNLPLFAPRLVLITVLATLAFSAVGTLFAAIAVNTRARDFMLPILFIPVVVPVIIAAVQASGIALTSGPGEGYWAWLQLVVAFVVIFLAVSFLAFEYVLEE